MQFIFFLNSSVTVVDLHGISENILTCKGQYNVPVFHLKVYVQVVEVESQQHNARGNTNNFLNSLS